MGHLRAFVAFLFKNFGPLLGFYAGQHLWGLRGGIAVGGAVTVGELVYQLARRQKLTQLFLLSASLTLGFGAIDLWLTEPRFLRFESVVSNVIVGTYFAASLVGAKPMLEELYERNIRPGAPARPQVKAYLRGLTFVWAGYFFAKAGLYTWLAMRYPLERAMAIRSVVGVASFGALLVGERLVRKPLFKTLAARGLLGEVEEADDVNDVNHATRTGPELSRL
jgi:uncharacterized membrane protein